jgi:hypothetical protein
MLKEGTETNFVLEKDIQKNSGEKHEINSRFFASI